ncbi:MAG: hypothetical protein WAQ05_14210 [Rubrivivax sp.]
MSPRPLLAVSLLGAALLTACGGGDDDSSLSQDVAQGYAADATTMTVLSASGMDNAADVLENTLTGAVTGSASCAGGGTVSWSITGGTTTQQLNGQLDAGETYSVNYVNCGVGDASQVLDGSLSLVVTAIGSGTADLTLTATALKSTTAQGSVTLNGTKRRQRSVVDLGGGARRVTAQLTSSSDVTATSSFSGRSASYTLRSLNWTIVRTFNTSGALTQRTHQGSLSLAANTPRRPNATLQINTQGTLTLASDGLASAGSFEVITSNNRIVCVYGSGSINLQLDLGNNGSIDRSWTLTRTVYNGEAG